jgi:hypothetical protein
MVASEEAGQRERHGQPPGEDPAWDDFLAGYPEATFYHTRIWARIVTRAFPRLEDRSRWIESGKGRAAVPLFGWKRLGGMLTTLQSSFPFLYGGPVPRFTGDHDAIPGLLDTLAGGGDSFIVIANPFARAPGSGAPPTPPALAGDHASRALPSRVEVEADSTQTLSLPARFEEYWEGTLTTAKRNDMRRLAKRGVAVRRGESPEEIAAVYKFYRDSFSRWGARPGFVYPEELYRAMIEIGKGSVRLYVAEFEGKIIGGAFIIRWNGRAHYHAGYFDHEARSLRPNILLQERIIRDAIEDGLREYDLLPSGGNAGVEAFKESFGAVRVPVDRLLYRAPLHRILDAFRGNRNRS